MCRFINHLAEMLKSIAEQVPEHARLVVEDISKLVQSATEMAQHHDARSGMEASRKRRERARAFVQKVWSVKDDKV